MSVLIVAPVGRDAQLIQQALLAADVDAHVTPTVEIAVKAAGERTVGALLITEEVMQPNNIALLAARLAEHPAWSDLPVLILTVGGGATALSRQREQDRLPLGNLTLLERPIRIATLLSMVRSALRSRMRQYQVRDMLLERDKAEASLRASEDRLLLAMETAQLGNWELDLGTRAVQFSELGRTSFDLPTEGALTQAEILERVHPEDRASMQHKLETAISEGHNYSAEYRVVWRNGTVHWISAKGHLLSVDGREGGEPGAAGQLKQVPMRLVGVTLDTTDRVLSEEALRKADKLALVGRLASSIAHEINNPLESVTNLLYLLAHSELGPTQKEYVGMAQQELARVSEIAAQTLTFNRQQNSYEEAVLPNILDSVLALYQGRLAMSNIQVRREYRNNQSILCYPGELRQVFTNLIGNAFDAMRRGGRMRVRERVATHPASGERGIRVTIADTGTGMTPAVQARLFEAFHSTKGHNGTGLGLWISRGIVEKHRGTLRFRSSTNAPHAGTAFSIFLPLP